MPPIFTLRPILGTVRTWHRRAASRRMLAGMDARGLRDIGLSPGNASFEARKPFWKP